MEILKFKQMMRLGEMGGKRGTKVIAIHPERNLNVCAKFYGNRPIVVQTFHLEPQLEI